MRKVQLAIQVTGGVASELFDALVAVERYPALTDVVRDVTVHARTPETAVTTWEVRFRDGILKWTEDEWIERDERRLRFAQIRGDFAHFAGAWEVREQPPGCVVRFTVEFDLGIPTLAPMLEPLAESALRENVVSIVGALSGAPAELLGAATA